MSGVSEVEHCLALRKKDSKEAGSVENAENRVSRALRAGQSDL